MSNAGVGRLFVFEGIMDQYVYINIIKENVKQSAQLLGIADDYYFQQDRDPKHMAYKSRQCIIFTVPHVPETPPQSPDINPIEHLWHDLETRVRKHNICNKSDLKRVLQEEWYKIPPETTQKLVSSMPRRLSAILHSRGYPTKY
jgi:hypothetical protein